MTIPSLVTLAGELKAHLRKAKVSDDDIRCVLGSLGRALRAREPAKRVPIWHAIEHSGRAVLLKELAADLDGEVSRTNITLVIGALGRLLAAAKQHDHVRRNAIWIAIASRAGIQRPKPAARRAA